MAITISMDVDNQIDSLADLAEMGDLAASTADKVTGILDTLLGAGKGAIEAYKGQKSQGATDAAAAEYAARIAASQYVTPPQYQPTFWQKHGTTVMVVGGVVVAAGAIYALTRKPYRAPAMAGLSGYGRGVHRGACFAGGCRRW